MAEIVQAKFSTKFNAVQMRIKRLPEIVDDLASATIKKDAIAFIRIFKEGIRDDQFGLTRLKPATIATKRRQGMSQPETPLYGMGDDEKNSYINTLRIRKVKKGWTVFRSNAKHHTADLTLKHLMAIHEQGVIINMGNYMIRIPPRPAYVSAFKYMLAEKGRGENVKEVRQAIDIYIKTGNMAAVNRYRKILQRKDFED